MSEKKCKKINFALGYWFIHLLILFSLDKNECLSSPCENDGECEDAVNGFICQCKEGYTGTKCEQGDDL